MVKIIEIASVSRVGREILRFLFEGPKKIPIDELLRYFESLEPFIDPEFAVNTGKAIKWLKEQELIEEISGLIKITEKGIKLIEEERKKARETKKALKMRG